MTPTSAGSSSIRTIESVLENTDRARRLSSRSFELSTLVYDTLSKCNGISNRWTLEAAAERGIALAHRSGARHTSSMGAARPSFFLTSGTDLRRRIRPPSKKDSLLGCNPGSGDPHFVSKTSWPSFQLAGHLFFHFFLTAPLGADCPPPRETDKAGAFKTS